MGHWYTALYLALWLTSLTDCRRLNDYILDYQPLTYDPSAVHRNHQRLRRSVDNHLYLRFSAYGRDFRLKLSPSEDVFSADHQVYTDGRGLHHVDTSFIFRGHVQGEDNSWVHLAIHNGSVEGEVGMPDTTYHIEPASKYLTHPSFHTIIYPETHLDTDPYREGGKETGRCAVGVRHVQDFMDKRSRMLHDPGAKDRSHEKVRQTEGRTEPHHMYTEHGTQQGTAPRPSPLSRRKRSLGSQNQTACPLHMRADPLLFKYFKETKHQSNITDAQAEEEILAFFSSHVSALTAIFSNTLFETYTGTMQNVGINFVIHRSTIMKDCTDAARSEGYCSNTLDVSNYLDLTSEEDHDPYCLVFTFTHRDFSGGTLGLAWVATESDRQSGVCGRYTLYSDGKKSSLNTAIVTIINFGQIVPNRVSQLTLAHEAGHNFGSPHDIGSAECAPFGTSRSDAKDGNYVMFPSATSGNLPHNNLFSACSKDNMTRIIQQVVDGTRHMCFVEAKQAFCGNQITEQGEQCDCGFGPCAPETCCEGRNDTVPGCTLAPGTNCSPGSGPCCGTDCKYKGSGSVCGEESECKLQAICTGSSFSCPDPQHKANGTYCSDYSKVCSSGECIGSVCQNVVDVNGTWEECFLTSEAVDSSALCFVACRNPGSGQCVSSSDEVALTQSSNAAFNLTLTSAATLRNGAPPSDLRQLAITLPPGSACDNFLGYCDIFSKCQRIDAQGPFNQLANMIFNPATLSLVKDWIVKNWWMVLLMSLGLVVLMAGFLKLCVYNTPSKDPRKGSTRPRKGSHRTTSVHPYSTSMEMDERHVPMQAW